MKVSVWAMITAMAVGAVFSGCEITTDPEASTKIEILSPASGSVLKDVTDITMSILNDDDLKYVQIMIDGAEVGRISRGVSKWSFNPVFYNDGKDHTMIAVTTDDGGIQDQSAVLTFSVDSSSRLYPVYTTPASGYIYPEGGEVTLDWDPVVNAEEYTVQISDDKTFSAVTAEITTEADLISFGTLENKVYFVRMNAVNKAEITADWTSAKKLYVGITEITWLNVFDYGAGAEWANSVTDLPDNSLVTVGPCWDAYMDYAQISVIKTDLNGDVIWQKMAGPEYAVTYGNSVVHDSENIYITGGTYDGSYNIYMIKLDFDGNVVWEKTFGAGYGSWAVRSKIAPDGSIFVQGDYDDCPSVCRVSPSGELMYAYYNYTAEWMCVDLDANGEPVILYGDYYGDTRRVKIDANGVVQSDELFGTTSIYDSSQIIAGADCIYVYDEDYSRLLKFGYDGSLAGSASMSGYYIIRITASGDYIYGTGIDYDDTGVMIKINSSLTVESDHSFNCGPLFDMTPLSDGSFILCGTDTQGGLQSSSKMVLLRTDKNGDCDEKSVPLKEEGEKLSVMFDRLK